MHCMCHLSCRMPSRAGLHARGFRCLHHSATTARCRRCHAALLQKPAGAAGRPLELHPRHIVSPSAVALKP